MKIKINGTNLLVHDRGEGPAILFVHGFPLDHSMWTDQLNHFSRSHRVIAPDLRGFGKSDPAKGTVEMKDFANDLAALLDALKVTEPICLCGLSMGGYVGLQFVRYHGERVGSLI